MLRWVCMLQSRGGSQRDPEEKHRIALSWPDACQMLPLRVLLTGQRLTVKSVSYRHLSNAAAGCSTTETPCAPLLQPSEQCTSPGQTGSARMHSCRWAADTA